MSKEEKAEYDAKHYRKNKERRLQQFQEGTHKGGKYYEKKRFYQMTGIPHLKRLIRGKHQRQWNSFKQIISPNSVLHHEWILGTADYRGVALVEADQHRYGIIDPLVILEGEITLLTEAEIRGDK